MPVCCIPDYEYLRKDNIRPLVLGADNDGLLMWYADASFAVHPNISSNSQVNTSHAKGGIFRLIHL